jgi:hypothetical protein
MRFERFAHRLAAAGAEYPPGLDRADKIGRNLMFDLRIRDLLVRAE